MKVLLWCTIYNGIQDFSLTNEKIEETDFWAMELCEDTDPKEVARMHGHEFIGAVGSLKNVYLFHKLPETELGVTHPHHNMTKAITWHERQVARMRQKRDER